jgi:capsular exopolysaccharide synthesis family protein
MERDDENLNAGSGAGGDEDRIDVRYYLNVIRKRRWVILAAFVVVTALFGVMTMRKAPIYAASTTVIVDPMAPNVLGRQGVEVVTLGSGNPWVATDYYNTQVRIIGSRSLAEDTVSEAKLYNDERIVGPVGATSEEDRRKIAAGYVQGRVSARFDRDSRVMTITVTDTNPELAKKLADAVADTYINRNVNVKVRVTNRAAKSVATLTDEAEDRLKNSETALYDFRLKHGILSVALEDQQNMLMKELDAFSTALTETKRKRMDAQARRKAVAMLIEDDALNASTGISQNTTIDSLRTIYLEERRKLLELEEKYGPKWPAVEAQQARVTSAKADMVAEAQTVLRGMDAEIKALLDAEGRYQAEVTRLTKEALELNRLEIDYKRLRRDAEVAAADYTDLYKRQIESTVQEKDLSNNISLLDTAVLPSAPVAPNMRNSLMLGAALGLLLGLLLAFGVEFLDRSVKSQEDVESVIGLPFLGMVPALEPGDVVPGKRPELYVSEHPKSTIAECLRVVRTNILFCSPDKPLRTLVVTSSNPEEGKTMTSINLGIVMAQNGHRTLLVDTDMRRARLHKAMGIGNENGVSRVILGESEIEDAVKTTDVPNLWVLPCGPHPPNPAELLQTEKFEALVRRLGEKYDRVIFDSPPVLAVTDAVVLSRVVDGVVLVVRAGRTARDALMRTKRLLRAADPNIAGVVLNDVNLKSPHYYSYYNYYNYGYHDASPAPAAATASGSKGGDKA